LLFSFASPLHWNWEWADHGPESHILGGRPSPDGLVQHIADPGSRIIAVSLSIESLGSGEGRPLSLPTHCLHQLPSVLSPLPLLGTQLQVLSAKRPSSDPDLKLPGLNSQQASQWADQIDYSVSFIYLEPHHRNLLVPKNCLLALSQRAAVSISTITILFCLLELWSPMSGPSFADPAWPCDSPFSPRTEEDSLPSAASYLAGNLTHSSWLPWPLSFGDLAPLALAVSPSGSLEVYFLPSRGE
jgi:hypothetical protein